MKKSFSRGFTLIELMVVTSIIGMLASTVLASVQSARYKAYNIKYVQELMALKQALFLYYENHKRMPDCYTVWGTPQPLCSDQNGLTWNDNSLAPLVTEGYISKIPHYFNWPSSSYLTWDHWAITQYVPYWVSGNSQQEYLCQPTATAQWNPGYTNGAIIVQSNQELNLTGGYTLCQSDIFGPVCLTYPPSGLTESGERVYFYCIPLSS